MPKRLERAVRGRLAEEFLETWPVEPLPALDGRTPEAAAGDPEARAVLLDIVKGMHLAAEDGRGILAPRHVRSLVERLGLTELETPRRATTRRRPTPRGR